MHERTILAFRSAVFATALSGMLLNPEVSQAQEPTAIVAESPELLTPPGAAVIDRKKRRSSSSAPDPFGAIIVASLLFVVIKARANFNRLH